MINLSSDRFDALEQEARNLLNARGFEAGTQERNGPFGSHYSEYNRDGERVTLAYDGRDNALRLRHTKDLNARDVNSQLIAESLSLKFSHELDNFSRLMKKRIDHAISPQ